MEEQAIACLHCGASELIRQDSTRLPAGQWPAWVAGLQEEMVCPQCGDFGSIWATEPRESAKAEDAVDTSAGTQES